MKKLYCITYDLNKEKDYAPLIESIKSFNIWWHQSGSVWYIASEKDSIGIREQLQTFLDSNDKLFVVRINSIDWAGTGFTTAEYDWLKKIMKNLGIGSECYGNV